MNEAVFAGSPSGQVENLNAVFPLAEETSGTVVGCQGDQSERVRGRVHGRSFGGQKTVCAAKTSLWWTFQRDIERFRRRSHLEGGGAQGGEEQKVEEEPQKVEEPQQDRGSGLDGDASLVPPLPAL